MLPRSVPHFTGRVAELARVRAHARRYGLVLLEGPPGCGKTALALELAGDYADPLWVSIPAEGRLEELFYAVGDGLWRDPSLPRSERLRLLARWLDASERALFLDDVHHLDDFRDVLSELQAARRTAPIFATTREKPDFPPPRDLDVLSVRLEGLAEAGALLDALLEHQGLACSEPERRALLDSAQGSPLLLKLQVSLLRQRKSPSGALAATLAELLASLDADERDLLEWLTVMSEPVPLAPDAVRRLERRYLVEWVGRGYACHALCRQLAAAGLGEERRAALHRRAAHHYRQLAGLAARQQAIRHTWAAGDRHEALALLRPAQSELFLAGQYEFILEWNERLRVPGLDVWRADVLAALGRTGEALELLLAAERAGSSDERIQAVNSRCHLLLEQGRLRQAAGVAREALAALEGLEGRRPGRVKALNALALSSARLGDCEDARAASREAAALARDIRDPRGEAYALYAESLAWRAERNWAESLAAARKARDACVAAGESRLAWLVRFVEGTALLALGRDAGEVLAVPCDYPDPLAEALSLAGRSLWLEREGRAAEAAEAALQALERGRRHGGLVFMAQLELVAGQVLGGEHRERARALAREAEAAPLLAELAGSRRLRVATPGGLGEAAEDPDSYDLLVDLTCGQARERTRGPLALLGRPVLTALLRSLALAGGPLTQRELHEAVWGPPYLGEESDAQVRKNISLLRDLLEPERRQPRYVLSVPGSGYRLGGRFCWIEPQEDS